MMASDMGSPVIVQEVYLSFHLRITTEDSFSSNLSLIEHLREYLDRFSGLRSTRDLILGVTTLAIFHSSFTKKAAGAVLEFRFNDAITLGGSERMFADETLRAYKYHGRHELGEKRSLVWISLDVRPTNIRGAPVIKAFGSLQGVQAQAVDEINEGALIWGVKICPIEDTHYFSDVHSTGAEENDL